MNDNIIVLVFFRNRSLFTILFHSRIIYLFNSTMVLLWFFVSIFFVFHICFPSLLFLSNHPEDLIVYAIDNSCVVCACVRSCVRILEYIFFRIYFELCVYSKIQTTLHLEKNIGSYIRNICWGFYVLKLCYRRRGVENNVREILHLKTWLFVISISSENIHFHADLRLRSNVCSCVFRRVVYKNQLTVCTIKLITFLFI